MGIYKLLGLSLPLNDNLQYRFYIKVICHSVRPLTSLNNQPFTILHTPLYLESFRLQRFIVSFFLDIVNAGEPAFGNLLDSHVSRSGHVHTLASFP